MDVEPINIRIEVDPVTDEQLEAWAAKEKRSKRSQAEFLLETLLNCYRNDPLILHRLMLGIGSDSPRPRAA